jgi:hypothetical protein
MYGRATESSTRVWKPPKRFQVRLLRWRACLVLALVLLGLVGTALQVIDLRAALGDKLGHRLANRSHCSPDVGHLAIGEHELSVPTSHEIHPYQ